MTGPLGPLEGPWLGFEDNLEEAIAEHRRASDALTVCRRVIEAIDDADLPPRFEQTMILEDQYV